MGAQGINRVMLVGNLTADPEMRHTQGGLAICALRLAVNGREKDGEEWKDRADFFDITVFGRQAEACDQYLSKGKPVAIDGRLRQERWQTDGGDNRSRVKVIADHVQFLNSREDGERGGGDPDRGA
jgi:single-strand DNA-binding protein